MIAGLEEVSEGEIAFDEAVVNRVPAKDRDVAMVFQNYALYPHLSVFDNMAFGLRMRRYPEEEIARRVAQAAEVLGLQALLERKPQALSGGQRQRVAVGRAIVRQPRVFLFDEPLSNLDARLRVDMRAELIRLHQRLRATMIYVTHDQVEAMSMGDLLIVLKDGVLQQTGPPLEVYARPRNRFVAGFLGSPPMNFLEARKDGSELVTLADGQRLRLPAARAKDLGPEARVILGLRPENLQESRLLGALEGATLRADVLFVEALGSEVLATCRLGGQEVVVRLPPTTAARRGAVLELAVDMERACFFSLESGGSLPAE
jgi:multiple sugar transport system ATP-binding protein